MEHTPEASHAVDHSHANDHDAEHVAKHVKGYLYVGVTLLFCTGLTVALSYFNFGSMKANIWVAMGLATFKVTLVGAIFMHLKSEKWTVYRILLITVVFAIGLFFLTALAMFDPIKIN